MPALGMRRAFVVDLYKDMIKVINTLEPKAFVFENVLMRGRFEIWKDVEMAFKKIEAVTFTLTLIPKSYLSLMRSDFGYENYLLWTAA